MRSSVSLALLIAGCGGAPDHMAAARPRLAPPLVSPDPTDAASYEAVGQASWYGEELRGNRTANGERFDPAGITAAHRTLPFGSFAEVTALDTGKTIVVRINDRGPHRRGRIIDLSRGAADLVAKGRSVFAVRVRALAPADVASARRGRDDTARRGYGDAQTLTDP